MRVTSMIVALGAVAGVIATPVITAEKRQAYYNGAALVCADGVVNSFCHQIGKEYKREAAEVKEPVEKRQAYYNGAALVCADGVVNSFCHQIGKEY